VLMRASFTGLRHTKALRHRGPFGSARCLGASVCRDYRWHVKTLGVVAIVAAVLAPQVAAQTAASIGISRLKDVTTLQGAATQPLIGYGLVVGLNKTGDRRQTVFSAQTLANMLERFGVAVSPGGIKIENVAAVMVTSEIGPYAQSGARLDITASSIGDARSLQGGTLLPTPLRGPDGSIVALAQGPLSIGGFSAGGGGNSVSVNHLTVGRVPGGGMVQVARQTAMAPTDELRLALHSPDFVSAGRIARAINMELGADRAQVSDAGTVVIRVPAEYRATLPDLVARLEPLPIAVDTMARVVINERTGTVVLGGDVRIGPAAVAHGNLSVRIATQYNVSQPEAFSAGQTTVTPQTQVKVDQETRQLIALEEGTTLSDVVRALNTLGVTPRDIIAIMQALKAAGALRAEVVIL
jgi:flagellar P-ring protein FlgI